jgi:hypothetical protein
MSVVNTKQSSGTGIFEICEKGFDVTTDFNIGLDLIDKQPAINGFATGVILPVSWLQFSISTNKASIKLDWSTSLEQNNKGFEVQRSIDANNGFAQIGWINANTNPSGISPYSYLDSNVLPNTRYYYRLKQLDKDGNFNYSETKTAILKEFNNKSIRIAPNPVVDMLNIYIDKNISETQASIILMDAKGVEVNRQMVGFLQAGSTYKIDMSGFSSGVYCIVIRNGNSILYYNMVLKQ